MIYGIGTDIVEVDRIAEKVSKGAAFRELVFTPHEIAYCEQQAAPAQSYAARFAAKEAVAKALGAPGDMHWHDAEVLSEESGRPLLELRGTVLARAHDLGVATTHLSLSHDAGIASAVVVLEG